MEWTERAVKIEILDEIAEWIKEKTAPNPHRKYSRCPICGQTWWGNEEKHTFVCWVPRLPKSRLTPVVADGDSALPLDDDDDHLGGLWAWEMLD